jgi:hypothetical protein
VRCLSQETISLNPFALSLSKGWLAQGLRYLSPNGGSSRFFSVLFPARLEVSKGFDRLSPNGVMS